MKLGETIAVSAVTSVVVWFTLSAIAARRPMPFVDREFFKSKPTPAAQPTAVGA